MAKYLALRLEKGKLDYNETVTKYPQFKDEVLSILDADGYKVTKKGEVVKK